MNALIPMSPQPNTSQNENNIRLKKEETASHQETGLCALNLHWTLAKRGVLISERTVSQILKQVGLVQKYV